MSSFGMKILLQSSRFQLIQNAMDIDFDDEVSPIALQFINTRLELLDQNWHKFQEEHEALCRSSNDSLFDHEYLKNRMFERCQEFYIHARAKMLARRDEVEGSLPSVTSLPSARSASFDTGPSNNVSRRLGSLPKIKLPRFSGDLLEWRSFQDLFSSLILINSDLTDVEKMHYLKTSLSGEALKFVVNLPISGANFAIAWDTLVSRYDNKRLLISAHIDRLTNLKPLKNKAATELSSFLATISESLGALRALGCQIEHWDHS
ncbi:PREDICTED: uncharacterized protein LOC105562154, partial [Vollenhovia emeryi]|uniref:uncharacterized protein LOC105562154 n=1 Tax=Vollenhovia emeryi TaxID=411798 RepID=UPI0005F51B82